MRIKTLHTVTILPFTYVILLGLAGCVDVNSSNFNVTDYRSTVRFSNLAIGAGTATNIRIDNDPYGNVAFGEAGLYKDIPSGLRTLTINTAGTVDTVTKNFESQRKSTLLIAGTNSARAYLLVNERYLYEPAGVSDGALVRFIHASPDLGTVSIAVAFGTQTLASASGLSYQNASAYVKLTPGTPTVYVISGVDTLLRNANYPFVSNKRYTIAIFGLKAAVQMSRFEDD
jgi:hypothetical protein